MSGSKQVIASLITYAVFAAGATTSPVVNPATALTASSLSAADRSNSSPSTSATITTSLSSSVTTTIIIPVKSFQDSTTIAINTTNSATSATALFTSSTILPTPDPSSAQNSLLPDPITASTSLAKPSPAAPPGLTISTRIGLGVSIGIGVPILILLVAILFLLIRRSRKQQRDLTEIDQKLAEPSGGPSRPETVGDLRGGSRTPLVAELEGTQVHVPVVVNKEEPTFSNDAHWKRILEERLEALQIGKKRLSEIEDDETEGMKNRFSGATEDGALYQRYSRYSDPETRVRSFPGPSTPRANSEGSPDRLQIPRFPSPYPNDPDLLQYSQMSLSRVNSQAMQRQRFSGWADDEPPPLQPQRQTFTDALFATEGEGASTSQRGRPTHRSDDGNSNAPQAPLTHHNYTTLSEESEIRRLQRYTSSSSAGDDDDLARQRQQQNDNDEERQQEERLKRSARWSDATTSEDAHDAQIQRSSGVTAQTRVQTLSSLDSDDLRTGSPVTQEDMNRWQHYG